MKHRETFKTINQQPTSSKKINNMNKSLNYRYFTVGFVISTISKEWKQYAYDLYKSSLTALVCLIAKILSKQVIHLPFNWTIEI